LNAEYRLLVTAERDYRATRLDYIRRLLPGVNWCDGQPLMEVSMTKIYVRNLDTDVTKKSVRLLFAPYGNVMRIRLSERQHARVRGKYAFVDMADAEASEAVRSLHGSRLGMQVLHVIKARTARANPKQGKD
jgi:RNA recognition motif-containing protein